MENFPLNNDVETRQDLGIARCRFKESLQPQLLKINKKFSRLLEAGAGGDAAHSTFVRNAQKDVAELADEVEGLILSHCSKVGPKEHSWIRATFAAAYKAKIALSMDDSSDLPSRMSVLRLVLNSFSICYDNIARTYAVSLDELVGNATPSTAKYPCWFSND
ncbi:unnamed protein product [Calypogeia fissa]